MQQTISKIRTFTDLDAWKEGHRLVVIIYRLTKHFPQDEQFGLTSQIRRAVISITSNVAEGFSRGSYKDKIRFYEMALGSLTEVQNQLLVARDVAYLTDDVFQELAKKTVLVHKLINGLIKRSRTYQREQLA